MPNFSIIIPTHNRAQLLPIAIDSVLAQTYIDWELIVVDDGSTDRTRQLMEEYDDHRIHYHFQEHKERSSARNRGIEEASGAYICFMDDDDYILEQYLALFEAYLTEHNYPETILRTGFLIKQKETFKKSVSYQPNLHPHPVHYATFNMCGVGSLCIPKVCLQEDRFPKDFFHWQDTHLTLRLLAKYSFHQLPAYQYVYVIHSDMGSKTTFLQTDPRSRTENNVNAMRHLFDQYGPLVQAHLPSYARNYIISKKYAQHACRNIHHRQYGVSFQLIRQALKYDQRCWHWKVYLRYVSSFVLKFLFGYPKTND